MLKIVLYDNQTMTEYEGYHITAEYFTKLLIIFLCDMLKPETGDENEKTNKKKTTRQKK